MDRLRYLKATDGPGNPDGLPIGIVKGREKVGGVEYLGMTCAACHPNRLEYGGARVQVEGGPTAASFEMSVKEMESAEKATLAQPDKFQRFAAAVTGEGPGPKAEALNAEFKAWLDAYSARVARNKPPEDLAEREEINVLPAGLLDQRNRLVRCASCVGPDGRRLSCRKFDH